jgi:AhpD family alkylhydroperoxidase
MRVPVRPLRSYPFYLQPFFWNQRRKYGEILQAALLWARAPKLFAAVAILYGMIDRHSSPIDPALRSLVTVRVSQINACSFCVDLNSAKLIRRGVSLQKVEALETWRQSNLFDRREQAVLDHAEAMTRSDLRVNDDQVERLRSYFDNDGIVELTGLIAFQNMSSKFNSALGVPAQGFCKMPSAGSSPR